MKIHIYAIVAIVAFFKTASFSEVTYIPLKKMRNSIWEADSSFLGASLKVKDSTKNVIAIFKDNKPEASGCLYFMVPGHQDSARVVFHNKKVSYPGEPDTVILGKFAINTPIVFMYKITDTSNVYVNVKNKRLYTGQNREGVDTYLSEISGPFGKRCAVAGYVSTGKCEIGFAAEMPGCYRDIRFIVDNVILEK